jgi:hypothetical protein
MIWPMRRLASLLLVVLSGGCDGSGGARPDAAPPVLDAGVGVDAASSAADAAAPDAGDFSGIVCGDSTCIAGDLCCTDTGGARSCAPDAPGACTGGDVASCDGPEDCLAAQICCGRGGGAASAACSLEADCTAGLPRCHQGADCASGVCCPQGFCGPGCD